MNPLNHVAIIMDGNGRWGLKYKSSRNEGHKAGLVTVEKIIKESIKQKISFLTLYAFSTENWNRPKKEVNYLFNLLENFGSFDNSCLEEDYIQCSLQRHMQALGAYCFLSKIKGLNHFEKFIMPAFEMLRSEFDLMKNKYPFLNELIGVAAKKL